MAVKIKLRRMGAKKHPFYRLVVGDGPAAAGGMALETLGTYDPHGEPPALSVQAERALHWLQRGAEPTESARQLLRRAGVMRQLAELKAAAKGQ
ncbi:MAG: 30S ribosomal protein S16 [Candidatus Methylomirabilota bacterium]|nr:MAG: 30S ribosomal protein S16 [candidate division NC10 bacterium]